ncbi:MAG: hypothetical protein L0Z55_00670 [Planctomycetes bacterium]|nr:hypothetical protein [Planctomycetota bacterium]
MLRSVNVGLLGMLVACALVPCASVQASDAANPVTLVVRGLDEDGNVGDVITVDVRMDNKEVLYGWSFGVCNDGVVELNPGSVANGSATATINEGGEPEFQSIVEVAGGFTVGAVTNFAQTASLAEGVDQHLYSAEYTLLAAGIANIDLCDTLGSPAVALVAASATAEFTPDTVNDTIAVFAPNEDYQMALTDAEGDLDATASIDVLFTTPAGLQGWSFGLCHDGLVELNAGAVAALPAAATVNGGSPPDFESITYYAGGVTLGAIVDFDAVEELDAGAGIEMYSVTYGLVAVGTAQVDYCDDLGAVPLQTLMVTASGEFTPVTSGASIEITEAVGALFKRGDINSDGITNALIDALFILNWQFSMGPEPQCRDAADVNGDNIVNALIDALFILNWQFSMGPAPPAPGPTVCGLDPDDDAAVTCATPPAACNP